MATSGVTVRLKDLVGKTDAQIFLIIGPPGAGKESFANQYLIDGFNENDNGVFLTTDCFPNDIVEKMKQLGTDPTQYISSKRLQFIDAFSYRTGEKIVKNNLAVDNIRDLTNLSVIIKSLIDSKQKMRLVINTISTISVYNSGVAVLDFIQAQVARLKQKNHSGIIIAHEGIMDEKIIQGIKAIVDGVIEFKPHEDDNGVLERRLRVVYAPSIKKSGWVSLYI
ncbi:MAG: RAD55 family ATPase [Candidatus Thorarchaeota archaeon]